MKTIHLLFSLLLILTFWSCEKDRVNPYFAEVYPQILDEIDIECNEGQSPFYMEATINGEEFCVYEDQLDKGFSFGVTTTFITSSPTLNTADTPIEPWKNCGVSFGDIFQHREEYFSISFPSLIYEKSIFDHLDSLLLNLNKTHDIIGKEDIVIPPGTPIDRAGLLKSNGGFRHHFLMTLRSYDKYAETGGNTFEISSIFGPQDGSFLRFNEVEKIREEDGSIYYYMDFSFECKLYHWPQYGYEGIWGEIKDGRAVVKVKVEE